MQVENQYQGERESRELEERNRVGEVSSFCFPGQRLPKARWASFGACIPDPVSERYLRKVTCWDSSTSSIHLLQPHKLEMFPVPSNRFKNRFNFFPSHNQKSGIR